MVSKSIRQGNIPTHATAVTEFLLTKLNIPIISQNVTAHTVIMILPWAQYIEFPQDFPLDSLMDPHLDFHQHILLVSPEAQYIKWQWQKLQFNTGKGPR